MCMHGGSLPACLADSGDFRALNFTAETTTLSYQSAASGSVQGFDNTMTLVDLNPFAVRPHPEKETLDHLAGTCATSTLQKDLAAKRRCEAEKLKPLFEFPNSRDKVSLSGGVHMVFLFQVTVHVGGCIAMAMLPESLRTLKIIMLPVWYFFGLLFIVLLYTADVHFNMRVPFNNVVMALLMELFSVFVIYTWTVNHARIDVLNNLTKAGKDVTEMVSSGKGDAVSVAAVVENAVSKPGIASAPEDNLIDLGAQRMQSHNSDLQHLMRLQPFKSAVNQFRSGQSNVSYTALGQQYNTESKGSELYSFNIFEYKLMAGELLEPFFIDCALTLPAVLLTAYVIGHRVPIDFVLQNIYIQTFLVFATLAIVNRIGGLRGISHRMYSMGNSKDNLRVDKAACACSIIITFLVAFSFSNIMREWIYPFGETTLAYADHGNLRHTADLVLWVIVFVALIFAVAFFFTISDNVAFLYTTREPTTSVHLAVFILCSVLMTAMRITLSVYMLHPGWWYGAFDKQDVLYLYS